MSPDGFSTPSASAASADDEGGAGGETAAVVSTEAAAAAPATAPAPVSTSAAPFLSSVTSFKWLVEPCLTSAAPVVPVFVFASSRKKLD